MVKENIPFQMRQEVKATLPPRQVERKNGLQTNEREKISWREIDRRKDRSPYAPKESTQDRERAHRSQWMKKHYRKEVDKLFMGKKGTKKHQKARDDIDRYHGTDQFEATVKDYLDQYGLPDDWNTLSLLLDYSDVEKVLPS
jgi:hypothetical protein